MRDIQSVQEVIGLVRFPNYHFHLDRLGDGFYLQVHYHETDVYTGLVEMQHGRKWYISAHSIDSEIVQTAFKAVITSMEHRAREFFTYRGANIFQPHFDVEDLVKLKSIARRP